MFQIKKIELKTYTLGDDYYFDAFICFAKLTSYQNHAAHENEKSSIQNI